MQFDQVRRKSIISCNLILLLKAPWEIPENDPPESWPNHGHIQFKNYSTSYRPGLDLVLENLSLSIHSGEKVRTVSEGFLANIAFS